MPVYLPRAFCSTIHMSVFTRLVSSRYSTLSFSSFFFYILYITFLSDLYISPFLSHYSTCTFFSFSQSFLGFSPCHPPSSLILPAPTTCLPHPSACMTFLKPARPALRSPRDLHAGSNPITATLLASACLLRPK